MCEMTRMGAVCRANAATLAGPTGTGVAGRDPDRLLRPHVAELSIAPECSRRMRERRGSAGCPCVHFRLAAVPIPATRRNAPATFLGPLLCDLINFENRNACRCRAKRAGEAARTCANGVRWMIEKFTTHNNEEIWINLRQIKTAKVYAVSDGPQTKVEFVDKTDVWIYETPATIKQRYDQNK
jgi:hypothetical protein